MIPVSATTVDSLIQKEPAHPTPSWQAQIKDSFSDVNDLLRHLGLNEKDLPYQVDKSQKFKLKVTRHFADLMTLSNPLDPLLMQVLPLQEENSDAHDFSTDPLLEGQFSPSEGLIHKYANRVLFIAHQSCAVHCRYCFRRHFPYENQRLTPSALDKAIGYIKANQDINEIILSGGDPLSLGDEKFTNLFAHLSEIEHISTIRIHTRTPVMAPERINSALLQAIKNSSKTTVMVLHINHPQELSTELIAKLKLLTSLNVTLLNQTVLLKGINDNAVALANLSNALFSAGVLPYYLHQLDKTQGTHHFLVDDEVAQAIWLELQANLSGYLVPRLVREIPDKTSKTWINPHQNWTS